MWQRGSCKFATVASVGTTFTQHIEEICIPGVAEDLGYSAASAGQTAPSVGTTFTQHIEEICSPSVSEDLGCRAAP